MMIWAVLATVAAVAAVSIWIAYRRHIRRLCSQLEFMCGNSTNMRLTGGLPFAELNRLADDINIVIDNARRLEAETQRSENDLKETIANLSHDIRTPLTSMDGYFQLLMQADTEEEKEHYCSIIKSRLRSLADMLEELFTYARLQDESYEIHMETVDFAKCAYDTLFSFYDDFVSKGIEPEIDFHEGHVNVTGNHEALERAFQNVIKNALVHGRDSIRLRMAREQNSAVFLCANSISEADAVNIDAERVFDRFYRADIARSGGSAGIGLSIARELVERMGGRTSAGIEKDEFFVEIRLELEG